MRVRYDQHHNYYCMVDENNQILGIGDDIDQVLWDASMEINGNNGLDDNVDRDAIIADLDYQYGVDPCTDELYEYDNNPDTPCLQPWDIKYTDSPIGKHYDLTTEEEKKVLIDAYYKKEERIIRKRCAKYPIDMNNLLRGLSRRCGYDV